MDRSVLPKGKAPAPKRAAPDIMLRLYSALVLITAALVLTLTSAETFAALVVLFMAAMAWEWGRLVRGKGLDLAFGAQLGTTGLASSITLMGYPALALLIVLLGTALVFLIRLLAADRPQAWWSAAGVCYAGFPAIALIWLRGDGYFGTLIVLYIFAIVWTTDSAAYLFGRWLGGPKLAPRISPKKTWAGFVGGLLSAGIVGIAFGALAGLSSLWLGLLAIGFALIAQLGDLGESAIKRAFGMKDTSGLIPGHGGVLDRIDGLIFVAVAAAGLAWLIDSANPGRTLLFWP